MVVMAQFTLNRLVQALFQLIQALRIAGKFLPWVLLLQTLLEPVHTLLLPDFAPDQQLQTLVKTGKARQPKLPVRRGVFGGSGVGARTLATKSAIMKSVSWPTAEMTGIVLAKIALATISSLNAHKSCAGRSLQLRP